MQYPDIELRPDRLYHEGVAAEVLSVTTDMLAKWREQDIGPEWTPMPNGFVRYYGESLLNYTTPEGLTDPRDLLVGSSA